MARLRRILDQYRARVSRTLQMNVTMSIAWSLGYSHLFVQTSKLAGEFHETENGGVFFGGEGLGWWVLLLLLGTKPL